MSRQGISRTPFREKESADDAGVRHEEAVVQLEAFLEQQKLAFADLQEKLGKVISDGRRDLGAEKDEWGELKGERFAWAFARVYKLKVGDSNKSAHWYEVWFVVSVGSALLFALWNLRSLLQIATESSALSIGLVRLVASIPIYALLVWLAFAAKRRVSEFRRLAEAYSHKMLLGKSLIGLSQQLKMVERVDPENGAALKREFLSTLIRAYERDVSSTGMVAKCETPIGEAADGVSKVVTSLSSLMPWKSN